MIAERFGVTELMVRRVLALTALTDDIKALYRAEIIDKRTLYALTLATKEQQEDWLTLLNAEDEYAPRGEQLKDWLTGGGRITTDKALFDLEAYDGTVLTDLFGETAIFGDADLFWTCQNEAIADMAERYRNEGWAETVVLERGAHCTVTPPSGRVCAMRPASRCASPSPILSPARITGGWTLSSSAHGRKRPRKASRLRQGK